ncbi:MAG: tail completion protein gp17 [Planctomycetota bacterium]|jgi:hypothetical protein
MNLAQVIHQRWTATEPLNDLLPAARVYTGMSVDPTTPYAIITRQSDRPVACLNDGSTVDRVGLRIAVFHDHYDAGASIVHQIKVAFHLAEFALSGSDKVISMRRSDDFERQSEDGVWHFAVDFNCTVYLASGV